DRDASGQGQVERLRPTRLRVCRQSGLCVRKARLGELLEGIHFLPERPALIGRYVGDGLEEIGDASALSAEELDAKTFDLHFGLARRMHDLTPQLRDVICRAYIDRHGVCTTSRYGKKNPGSPETGAGLKA